MESALAPEQGANSARAYGRRTVNDRFLQETHILIPIEDFIFKTLNTAWPACDIFEESIRAVAYDEANNTGDLKHIIVRRKVYEAWWLFLHENKSVAAEANGKRAL